ncbi:hypothetical protein G6O67_008081 [Ophiocordyceps sinensis]|nr:hypothetical protein G6O67_008081 [Ophiocordyceps sinensis]
MGQAVGDGGRCDDERRGTAERSLFVGGAMSDVRCDTDIERSGSPLPFEQEEPLESIEREESGLFVREGSEVLDLTNDE